MAMRTEKEKYLESNPRWVSYLFAILMFIAFTLLIAFSRSAHSDELLIFYLLMGFAYLVVFTFVAYLLKSGKELSGKYVFGTALVFHLIGLLGMPLFEDDYFRYLWDAYHTVAYGSPYGVAPSEYFDFDGLGQFVPAAFHVILSGINYPDIPTIYGPTFQYSFLLAYFMAPGEIWALQLIYSAVDMVLVAALLQLARPTLVVLYAWSPLVFKEVILTAHPDGLAVCLLLIAVICSKRKIYNLMAISLAASLAAKVFAVLFIPFLLFKVPIKSVLIFIISLIVLYLPLLIFTEASGTADLIGLGAMAKNWQFNSAFYGLLSGYVAPMLAKLFLGLALLVGFTVYFYQYHFSNKGRHKGRVIRGDLMMGAFLLCSPVINPWYLLWVLPFAVIHFNLTAWFASAVILMAYMVGLNLENYELLAPYQQPYWVRPVEYGMIVMFLFLLFVKDKRRARMTSIFNNR